MRCKAVMLDAGVPTVPGSPDLVKDADEAIKIAQDIGYPILLKVYGGGGRGIRLVNSNAELHETGESMAAFGKSAILVEKYLEKIRHIFQLGLQTCQRLPSTHQLQHHNFHAVQHCCLLDVFHALLRRRRTLIESDTQYLVFIASSASFTRSGLPGTVGTA